jgi:predicted phosphoribosyltransferase
MWLFEDRRDAGRRLAEHLRELDEIRDAKPDAKPLVVALPRGGVPVAAEVARALGAPLDVLVVRKLGVPGNEELAMGAIASGGVCVVNEAIVRALSIDRRRVDAAAARELREVERRERLYRGGRPALAVRGRTVVLVDDGLATGATMRAGARALRGLGVARLVAAVPVGAPASCEDLAREVDVLVCPERPDDFYGVGQWYARFGQTSDDEVRALLASAARGGARGEGSESSEARERGEAEGAERASGWPRAEGGGPQEEERDDAHA